MSDAATATGGRRELRDHHGGRLTARAGADARGDAALQHLALRAEAARGAEEEQAPDDVGMVGRELLGDAAAGRRAHDVDLPAQAVADGVGVLGRDLRHRHAPREPGRRLTRTKRRRSATSVIHPMAARAIRSGPGPV